MKKLTKEMVKVKKVETHYESFENMYTYSTLHNFKVQGN